MTITKDKKRPPFKQNNPREGRDPIVAHDLLRWTCGDLRNVSEAYWAFQVRTRDNNPPMGLSHDTQVDEMQRGHFMIGVCGPSHGMNIHNSRTPNEGERLFSHFHQQTEIYAVVTMWLFDTQRRTFCKARAPTEAAQAMSRYDERKLRSHISCMIHTSAAAVIRWTFSLSIIPV